LGVVAGVLARLEAVGLAAETLVGGMEKLDTAANAARYCWYFSTWYRVRGKS